MAMTQEQIEEMVFKYNGDTNKCIDECSHEILKSYITQDFTEDEKNAITKISPEKIMWLCGDYTAFGSYLTLMGIAKCVADKKLKEAEENKDEADIHQRADNGQPDVEE